MTAAASQKLTEIFHFPIPQRWSIAHLYQAILNGEKHVDQIRYLTTLDGYIHWKLTGQKVIGIGQASGMFPIDTEQKDYRKDLAERFDQLIADKKYPWKVLDILPEVRSAGVPAGTLTEEGAAFLDPDGDLRAGIPMCPPEMRAPEWWRPTVLSREPEMYQPVHPYFPWWFWSIRSPVFTRNWTW